MVKEADLIITVLPDQKKDLVRLFPKAAGRIFTIREISEWDDYLLQEDYDFKEIPRDSTLWDYVEENPDYVSNILFEMEKMLIKAYPSIMAKLRLRVGE
jgi:protein-tyrosine-phosphatase